jgi:hypothetical protein
MIKELTPLVLITALRATDDYIKEIYTWGSCYRFHLFLKTIWPKGKAVINEKQNHIATEIEGRMYDITGDVTDKCNWYYLTRPQVRKAKKWSFARNNWLRLGSCPNCEEDLIYDSYKPKDNIF